MYHKTDLTNRVHSTQYGYPEHQALQRLRQPQHPRSAFYAIGDSDRPFQEKNCSVAKDDSGGHKIFCSKR